jgi:CHAD domain-containing protein
MTQQEQEQLTLAHNQLPAFVLLLFDRSAAAHRLDVQARGLLECAAVAYAAALCADAAGAPRLARDALLAGSISELPDGARSLAAAVAALQRPKLRPQREPALLALGARNQARARRLAAILQLARTLSAQPAAHVALHAGADGAILYTNASADALASAAQRWSKVIGPLTVAPPADEDGAIDPAKLEAVELPSIETSGALRADEPYAEGARRMLRRMFDRMLAREEEVVRGEEPEDVHQMRVAIRRLRASLQVAERVFAPDRIRRFRRKLRRMALALGDVRDWDVFLEAIRAYADTLPAADRAALDPLTEAVGRQRALARAALEQELASDRYNLFKREFSRFLTTPGADAAPLPPTGAPPLVRDGAGSAIWERYEQWRAFDPIIRGASEEQLHQARIAGKRLRYTLEFFADALGPKVDDALAPLTALQELLGTLQDAAVARAHIAALGLADDEGAQAFLAARSEACAAHAAELPRLWEKVAGATYRRRLWEMITRL